MRTCNFPEGLVTARRTFLAVLLGASVLLLAGCGSLRPAGITQVATIDALLAGVYDGHMSLRELQRHGDFGLGTYDRLDGEMIFLDGKFFKVRGDGKVVRPPLTDSTPFACVTRFAPTRRAAVEAADLQDLQKRIDLQAPEQNRFCAFRMRGEFHLVTVRSVPAQIKPYRPLAEVTKTQRVFNLSHVRGTLIGFRCPAFVKGMNVPGYHMHFLSDDARSGGHVLGIVAAKGSLETDSRIDWLHVFLPPQSGDFARANLTSDRSHELHAVEQATEVGR